MSEGFLSFKIADTLVGTRGSPGWVPKQILKLFLIHLHLSRHGIICLGTVLKTYTTVRILLQFNRYTSRMLIQRWYLPIVNRAHTSRTCRRCALCDIKLPLAEWALEVCRLKLVVALTCLFSVFNTLLRILYCKLNRNRSCS